MTRTSSFQSTDVSYRRRESWSSDYCNETPTGTPSTEQPAPPHRQHGAGSAELDAGTPSSLCRRGSQEAHRPGSDRDHVAGADLPRQLGRRWIERVDLRVPDLAGTRGRDGEVQRLPPGIDQDQEVVVDQRAA